MEKQGIRFNTFSREIPARVMEVMNELFSKFSPIYEEKITVEEGVPIINSFIALRNISCEEAQEVADVISEVITEINGVMVSSN